MGYESKQEGLGGQHEGLEASQRAQKASLMVWKAARGFGRSTLGSGGQPESPVWLSKRLGQWASQLGQGGQLGHLGLRSSQLPRSDSQCLPWHFNKWPCNDIGQWHRNDLKLINITFKGPQKAINGFMTVPWPSMATKNHCNGFVKPLQKNGKRRFYL